jgi:hypothetical protein
MPACGQVRESELAGRTEMPAGQPAAAQPVRPMRLPLYLVGRKAVTVRTDGPALLAQSKGEAARRYPLARIARVLTGPRNEWRPCALAACQQSGLPIVFLDAAGRVTGHLQPWQPRPSTLHGLIAETLARRKWQLAYHHWFRAECMRLVHRWCEQRVVNGKPVNDRDRRELIRSHVYQPGATRLTAGWHPLYEGAITAYVMQALREAGLEPCYWGENARPLHLAQDLTQLAELSLRLEMHGLGQAVHGDNSAMLHILHSFGETIGGQLRTWLGSLHRNLRTGLEQWH